MKLTWIIVSCNSNKEGQIIGKKLINQRLIACFSTVTRQNAFYFWPPKSNKIETSKGCWLILETLPSKFKLIEKIVKQNHSDKLPFIGNVEIGSISKAYHDWLKGEIKK